MYCINWLLPEAADALLGHDATELHGIKAGGVPLHVPGYWGGGDSSMSSRSIWLLESLSAAVHLVGSVEMQYTGFMAVPLPSLITGPPVASMEPPLLSAPTRMPNPLGFRPGSMQELLARLVLSVTA